MSGNVATVAYLKDRERRVRAELYMNRRSAESLKRQLKERPEDERLKTLRQRQQDRKTELLASLGALDLPPVVVLRDVIDTLVKIEDLEDSETLRSALSRYIDALEKKETKDQKEPNAA